jgi:hypothetical protein
MKLLTVHSKDRSYGHPFQCVIPAPTPFKGAVKLVGVLMPLALLPLRSPYNTLTFTQNSVDTTITVSQTSKSVTDLLVEMNGLCDPSITFTYSTYTLLITVTSTGAPITIHDGYLAKHLGLTGNPNGTPVTSQTGTTIVAVQAANLCYDTCLYVCFDEWATDNIGQFSYHAIIPILDSAGSFQVATEGITFRQMAILINYPVGAIKVSIRDIYGNVPDSQLDFQLIFQID